MRTGLKALTLLVAVFGLFTLVGSVDAVSWGPVADNAEWNNNTEYISDRCSIIDGVLTSGGQDTWRSKWYDFGNKVAPDNIVIDVIDTGYDIHVRVLGDSDGDGNSDGSTVWYGITSTGAVTKDISSLPYSEQLKVEFGITEAQIDNFTVNATGGITGSLDYTVNMRWEENYEMVDNISNRNWELEFVFENETKNFDVENNPQIFTVNMGNTGDPYMAVIDTGSYSRHLITVGQQETTFFIYGDNSDLGAYTLTLNDWTNSWDTMNGQVWIWKKYGENDMKIDERWWDGEGKAYPILKIGGVYRFALHNDETGATRWYDPVDFPTTLTKTIKVMPEYGPGLSTIYDTITWGASRTGDNIDLSYFDNSGDTENVRFRIYEEGTDNLQENTGWSTMNDFSYTWTGADNRTGYRIVMEANHDNYGYINENTIVDVNPETWELPTGGTSISDDAGLPVSATTLFSVMIVAIASMSFGALFSSKGMLFVSFLVAFLVAVGLLPLSWEIVGFLFTISIVWLLGDSA